MKLSYHSLMSVLYHPASYTHFSHLPGSLRNDRHLTQSQSGQRLLNYWLINHYALPAMHTLPAGLTPLQQLLLDNWHQLANIAQLTGAWLLRQSLFSPRQRQHLTREQQQFMTLPIGNAIQLDANGRKPIDVGAALLQVQFHHAPTAIRQRLPLLFPQHCADTWSEDIPPALLSNLTRMAVSYANPLRH